MEAQLDRMHLLFGADVDVVLAVLGATVSLAFPRDRGGIGYKE